MKNPISRTFPLLALAIGATLLLGTSGCAATKAERIRANYTPYLDSTAKNAEQDRNTQARVIDHNTRSIWDDLNRILLLDKPSHANIYYIP